MNMLDKDTETYSIHLHVLQEEPGKPGGGSFRRNGTM